MMKRPRYTFADLELTPPSDPPWVSLAITTVVFAGCFAVMFAFVFM